MEMATFSKLFAGMVSLFLFHLVPASQPFYEKGDILFAPGLLGAYAPLRMPQAPQAPESLEFRRDGNDAYRLIVTDKERTIEFKAVLFRIDAATYLDLVPLRGSESLYRFDSKKAHLAARVDWDALGVRFRLVASGMRWDEIPTPSPTHDLRSLLRRKAAGGEFLTLAEFYRE